MKIQIVSDLHLEFDRGNVYGLPKTDANILILAGDVQVGTNGTDWFLNQLETYDHVLYLAGNHEYYHHNYDEMHALLPWFAKEINHDAHNLGLKGILHYFDNDELVIEDVRFLGTTLWTDFSGGNMASMGAAGNQMNDFRIITKNQGEHLQKRRLTPQDTMGFHQEAVQYLTEKLSDNSNYRKNVVITHHLPSLNSVHWRFTKGSNAILNGAFASNLDRLVEQADLWIHGHTHDSFDYTIGKCRVLCNPRGYAGYQVNRDFDAELIVEV